MVRSALLQSFDLSASWVTLVCPAGQRHINCSVRRGLAMSSLVPHPSFATVFSGENYRELIARCAAGTKSAPPTRRGQEEDPGRPGKAKVYLERTVGTTSKVAVFRRSNFECVRSMKLISYNSRTWKPAL